MLTSVMLKNAHAKGLISEEELAPGKIKRKKAVKLNNRANSMGAKGTTKKAQIARSKYRR